MPTKIFIYACVLLGIQDSYSQPNLQWATIFNGGPGSQEMGYDIKVDGNLNVYVTGYSRLYQQNYNFITIKYNSSGDTLWTKRYNAYYCIGGYDNGGWTIDVDASGGVYVGGGASVLKYDASGNFLWKHDTLPTVKLIIYNNQYVYTTGWLRSCNTSYEWIKTNKFDLNGNLIWSRLYTREPNHTSQYPRDMVIDRQGNIIVTGSDYATFVTIKYNPDGDSLWTRRYPAGYDAFGVAVDTSNNVFVTGWDYTGPSAKYLTIKYSAAGDSLWVQRYEAGGSGAGDIQVDRLGNPLITGISCSNYCYTTVKYTSGGAFVWSRSYNSSLLVSDENMLVLDSLDNAYVLVRGVAPPDTNALRVIKYDPNGNNVWTAVYGLGVAGGRAITLDKFCNLYATGSQSQKLVTVKFSQTPTGIQNTGMNIPLQFNLFQNYPNPFNPTTRIKFDVPSIQNVTNIPVKVVIYDILGRQIATPFDQDFKPGSYEIEWDASDFPSGVYAYRLISGDYYESRRMIFLK